jgi:lysophospholipid acyltransferase (LPLAT)-like uncharacterized protein
VGETPTSADLLAAPDAGAAALPAGGAASRVVEIPSAPRKPFSLTRARPSAPELAGADRMRAAVFSAMALAAVSAVGATMQYRTRGEAALRGYRRLGRGRLLFALWHGDFLPIMRYARDQGVCVVVSRSPDGEILDRLLRSFGYCTVRGSNRRRGMRSMVELARMVRHGADAAVAVDGPRGPALVAKAGLVVVARVTGCPIVPLGVGIDRYKQFASWDSFRFPLPFARAVLTAGTPIMVPRHCSLEQKRRELQAALMGLRGQAQRLVTRFEQADPPLGFATSRD